jgi:hypothetical protein
VLEIATDGLLNTAEDELPAGRLVRVDKDGSRTTLASEGLAAPGGFVLGHGAASITNNSILSDAGQVVKVAIRRPQATGPGGTSARTVRCLAPSATAPRCARGRRGAESGCSCRGRRGGGSRASPGSGSRCGR